MLSLFEFAVDLLRLTSRRHASGTTSLRMECVNRAPLVSQQT
jgi:hypothetical protein